MGEFLFGIFVGSIGMLCLVVTGQPRYHNDVKTAGYEIGLTRGQVNDLVKHMRSK